NESFQYTAPKQPRKSSNPGKSTPKAQPPGAPAVLYATAVQAFRYINGQYVKQGKLGAAALGNHASKEYKILLYLSQQKQVTAARIHTGFVFTVQPNNYCTFYDDQRQNWSLMFESEKASSDFCKEVSLAKANSATCLDTVVVQDLSLGEGQGVENGDSLEVLYTGWLLQNHTIGQMFDSNHNKEKLLRLKIGAGKVIKGWEEGMLGMKKAGRRLIIIPPNLGYGSKGVPGCIPSNSTLIFETELRRVKFSKDSSSDRASASSRDSAAPSPAPSSVPSVDNVTPEPPVQLATPGPSRPGDPPLHAKSNSISEQLANPDASKAKLISRMAKMGQPMLPFLTGMTSQPESSDSELEDTSSSKVKDRPVASSPVQISTAAPAAQMILLFSSGSSDLTAFLMTEARQYNTEVRLAVGKVADKVDQLTAKMDDLQRQGNLSMAVSSMSMETSMIMHNIQRIVQENECLKKEVFEKSSRIEEQNCKIGELINQNQRYMEQSHLLLEQRNDSLKSSSEQNQARLLQAEKDKHALPQDLCSGQVRLTEDLASSTARLSQLQLEVTSQQQKAVELQSKLSSVLQDSENHCQCIAALETQQKELKETAERAQAQYRSEKQLRKDLELRVNNLEEEVQDLRTDKESLERALVDRKKKWQAERQRREEEVEELRKSNQQEFDNLRAQLRKARTSTDSAVSEQLSQLQTELDEDWKRKCEQMLASAKDQHSTELADVTEQRDALQDKLTQLEEKFMLLKQSRDSEEQRFQQQHGQTEELQALQEKVRRMMSHYQNSKRVNEGEASCLYLQVKRVMNGVFHSLRGEFDLSESYTGQAVLAVIVTTIKNVTLQLLSGTGSQPTVHMKKEEAEEHEDEESDDVAQREEKVHQNEYVNGERHVKEEEKEEEHVAELSSQELCEIRMNQEVAAEKEVETAESKIQSQTKDLQDTDLHPVPSTEARHHESEVQQEPREIPTEEKSSQFADPDNKLDESSPHEDGQRPVLDKNDADVPNEVDNVEHVGGKAFGPPANPPPPPKAQQDSTGEETCFHFFICLACVQSLKGHPPPAPLFGDDEDENDLDWLN
uniref:peptidylprolyl isomerase n=1 Tax=Echeneis naucrates TaxID=173247 RepID=A0A665W484_ECHNA